MRELSKNKRKQDLFHMGACIALSSYATEFLKRNKYSPLWWAFWRHTQHMKSKYMSIEPQTPSERHAYERGKKRGQHEREQIARRPIELLHVVNCGVCKRNGGDVALIHAEINPDQHDLFFPEWERARLGFVNVYFDTHAPVESGDMAAVLYKRRYLLCTVKYIDNKIELYDPRSDKLFATVRAGDRFEILGKLDSTGHDIVYPNAINITPLSDETRKRGYVTAADIVRGKAANNVSE